MHQEVLGYTVTPGDGAGVEGVARLRSPWTADSTLRLAIEDQRKADHVQAPVIALSVIATHRESGSPRRSGMSRRCSR